MKHKILFVIMMFSAMGMVACDDNSDKQAANPCTSTFPPPANCSLQAASLSQVPGAQSAAAQYIQKNGGPLAQIPLTTPTGGTKIPTTLAQQLQGQGIPVTSDSQLQGGANNPLSANFKGQSNPTYASASESRSPASTEEPIGIEGGAGEAAR